LTLKVLLELQVSVLVIPSKTTICNRFLGVTITYLLRLNHQVVITGDEGGLGNALLDEHFSLEVRQQKSE
jgi:hypothetical protein